MSTKKKEEVIVRIASDVSSDWSGGQELKALGGEVVCGKISQKNIDNLINNLENNSIYDSDICGNWSDYDDIYHNQGVFLPLNDGFPATGVFKDYNEESTDNWEHDVFNHNSYLDLSDDEYDKIISRVKPLDIPKKGTYILSIRQEDVYTYYMGEREKSDKKSKASLYYSDLSEYSNIDFAILDDVKLDGVSLERDIEAEDIDYEWSDVYALSQHIIKDGEVIAWITHKYRFDSGIWDESFFEFVNTSSLLVEHDYEDTVKYETEQAYTKQEDIEETFEYKKAKLIEKLKS